MIITEKEVVASTISNNVKTSNRSPVIVKNTYSSVEEYLKESLGEAFDLLSHAKTMTDVKTVFEEAEKAIGDSEIAVAIILYCIHIEKSWESFGYENLTKFIDDLRGSGIKSRQTYYNMVDVGEFISGPIYQHSKSLVVLKHAKNNFCKLLLLARFFKRIKNKSIPFDPHEWVPHYLNDTYTQFDEYIRNCQRRVVGYSKPQNQQVQKSKRHQNPKNQKIPKTLVGDRRRIYNAVQLGQEVVIIEHDDPDFESKFAHLINIHRRERHAQYNFCSDKPIAEYFHDNRTSKYLENLKAIYDGWFRDNTIYSGYGGMNTPDVVKHIVKSHAKCKTDYVLAEAYLIHSVEIDKELQKGIMGFEVTKVKDFAIKILGISESLFKRLRKIGSNLTLVERLQGEINLTDVGFLEKIYFLDKAVENHKNDQSLIVDGLKRLSAKHFREFARDKDYAFDDEPIESGYYKMALPHLDEYDKFRLENKSVKIIVLREKWEEELLKTVLRAIENGTANRFYGWELPNTLPLQQSA